MTTTPTDLTLTRYIIASTQDTSHRRSYRIPPKTMSNVDNTDDDTDDSMDGQRRRAKVKICRSNFSRDTPAKLSKGITGVYILSSNLKNFPPPCIFNLISFPKEKKARSDFCLFWGLKGGLPPCQNFFLGNLSIILAFSEQLFHNFPSLPLLSNLPHLIFFPNTPTT